MKNNFITNKFKAASCDEQDLALSACRGYRKGLTQRRAVAQIEHWPNEWEHALNMHFVVV